MAKVRVKKKKLGIFQSKIIRKVTLDKLRK